MNRKISEKMYKKASEKTMKKTLALLLVFLLSMLCLTGCSGQDAVDEPSDTETNMPDTVSAVINIAALNGPTGMGMVQLLDQTEKYQVTTYQAPTDVAPKLINGEVDVAALPSNMAAVLYNKTEGDIVAISPIALGVLYILGNGVEMTEVADLAGKTIVASGQGGTPEYALQYLLQEAGLTIGEDVQVEWLASHADVNSKLQAEEDTIAMLPEPFVSTAIAAGGEKVTQLFDLNQLWQEATGEAFPMGVLVARRAFVEERADDLAVLLQDCQASVDFVNAASDEAVQLIVDKGFIGKAEIAKAAIPRCSIVLYSGDRAEEGAQMLKTFNETMFAVNPAAVGGKLPADDLYWSGK